MRTGISGLRSALVLGLVTGIALLVPIGTAKAATIQVTRFDDPAEDGCGTNGCSLREAVQQANGDSVADTIVLAAGTYTLTQPGADEDAAATGDLDVLQDATIQGVGSATTIIDGQWSGATDRIFHVFGAGAHLTLLGVTVRDGDVTPSDGGGGIFVETGQALTATDVIVRNNRASYSGGIDNDGAATLSRVWFIENAADCCGGFYNEPGSTATMTDVVFLGNTAVDDTGAIYSAGTSLSITNALFAGNTSGPVRGGAIISTNGTLDITNATFSGNSAGGSGSDGAAIATEEGSTTNLNNVTITGNSATGEGGGIYREDGTINIRNSIIAGNTDTGGEAPDCGSDSGDAFTSGGHNLIGSATGCTFTPGSGDLTSVNPMLNPLADNGGLTETHALQKGSPAINAGGPDCAPTDQRGLPRNCDIGAYELVLCRAVPVNRIGTPKKDSMVGTPGSDGILGFGGNDKLRGKGGKDGVCGGPGKDLLKGGGGKDRLDGGPGRDTCVGQSGRDKAKACEKTRSIP